jgi:hypothetical protein
MLARKTPLRRVAFKSKPAAFGVVRADVEPKTEGKPKPPKTRKCAVKECRKPFVPDAPFVVWCGPDCGEKVAHVRLAKQRAAQSAATKRAKKAERANDRAKGESLKTLPELLKEAQIQFNRCIRLRDMIAGHPCISSGRKLDWSGNATDAGHYRSIGAAGHLRFNEDNVHAQSKHDNQYKAGNVVEYRINLIARIGLERVEALENNNTVHKWTKDEVRAIRDTYRAKASQLAKEQHHA